MTYKKFALRDNNKNTLADGYGLWCARCLKYLPRDQNDQRGPWEFHHLVQRLEASGHVADPRYTAASKLKRTLSDLWVVPVHAGDCHTEIEKLPVAASLFGESGVRNRNRTLEWKVKRVGELHDLGLYGLAFLFNYALRTKVPEGTPEYRALTEHLVANGCNLSWASDILDEIILPKETELSALMAMKLAGRELMRHDIKKANVYLDKADHKLSLLPKPEQEHLRPSLLRTRAGVKKSTDDAVASREGSSGYTYLTGLVLEAAIEASKNRKIRLPSRVGECLEEVRCRCEHGSLSLMYLTHVWLPEAWVRGPSSRKEQENMYMALVRIQFLTCVLGLISPGHILEEFFQGHKTAGSVLVNCYGPTSGSSFTKETLLALRHRALKEADRGSGKRSIWDAVNDVLAAAQFDNMPKLRIQIGVV